MGAKAISTGRCCIFVVVAVVAVTVVVGGDRGSGYSPPRRQTFALWLLLAHRRSWYVAAIFGDAPAVARGGVALHLAVRAVRVA